MIRLAASPQLISLHKILHHTQLPDCDVFLLQADDEADHEYAALALPAAGSAHCVVRLSEASFTWSIAPSASPPTLQAVSACAGACGRALRAVSRDEGWQHAREAQSLQE